MSNVEFVDCFFCKDSALTGWEFAGLWSYQTCWRMLLCLSVWMQESRYLRISKL